MELIEYNGTVTAIKALQRDCNLSVDGVVGKETWEFYLEI
ncbi:peptidoglycan-binding domain-containing protein [Clostridium botulinum]